MNEQKIWADSALELLENTPLRESYLIGLWNNALTTPVLKQIEKNFDVTRDEFNVIFTLKAKGPLLASEICHLNSRPKNSISRAVTRLYKRHALVKTQIESDKRKEQLSLTEHGVELYNLCTPFFLERQKELMSPLDYEERRQLEFLMKKTLLENPKWLQDM